MSVTVETMTIPGSLPEGTNPLPRFRRQNGFGTYKIRGELPPETAEGLGSCTLTLPYRMQDRYRRENRPVTLKTIGLLSLITRLQRPAIRRITSSSLSASPKRFSLRKSLPFRSI